MAHFVYILECADGTLYTGYCRDIEKRLKEHNGESVVAGAKYTSGRRPVKMMYHEALPTRSAALKREYAIKQLTKAKKQLLWKQST